MDSLKIENFNFFNFFVFFEKFEKNRFLKKIDSLKN